MTGSVRPLSSSLRKGSETGRSLVGPKSKRRADSEEAAEQVVRAQDAYCNEHWQHAGNVTGACGGEENILRSEVYHSTVEAVLRSLGVVAQAMTSSCALSFGDGTVELPRYPVALLTRKKESITTGRFHRLSSAKGLTWHAHCL